MDKGITMADFLKQTGEGGYFDIRLTTGEAIALLDSLSQGEHFRSENKDKPHPELRAATEKIARGWMIMTRDGNNELV
jgi:hypothetical protein|tara:strand:- start:587 stop:820 length:234 start_codon:yes stop_codon:yes gene_type:complete